MSDQRTLPEPPLTPPDDDLPYCPQCEAILERCDKHTAQCAECGWFAAPEDVEEYDCDTDPREPFERPRISGLSMREAEEETP
jgi:hypothetical protein